MKESPKTIDEVRKLMGLPNYYRRYMEKFTRIAKPIHDLVKVVDLMKLLLSHIGTVVNNFLQTSQLPGHQLWKGLFNVS